MAHQYERRSQAESWGNWTAFSRFWTRRIFRIAPLYYLLLAIALPLGPYLGRKRIAIAAHYPDTMTNAARYTGMSVSTVATHVSFLFGAIPRYSFQTPLPDWSIGLEMQFYFVFPFLMLFVARFGYLAMILVVMAFVEVGSLTAHGLYNSFPEPSFLPLRLHLFLLGMLLAAAIHGQVKRGLWIFVLGIPVIGRVAHVSGTVGMVVDIVFAALLLVLAEKKEYSTLALAPIRRLLDTKLMQSCGNISYSMYLVHLLFVLPICAALLSHSWYVALPEFLRFLLAFGASAAFVIPSSLLLHRMIEMPGAALGKRMLQSSGKTKNTQTSIDVF
jgi:peptidoglycan/LPS O-acetylase OafA/YrhL